MFAPALHLLLVGHCGIETAAGGKQLKPDGSGAIPNLPAENIPRRPAVEKNRLEGRVRTQEIPEIVCNNASIYYCIIPAAIALTRFAHIPQSDAMAYQGSATILIRGVSVGSA
jgi:hypothetical protein